MTNDKQTANPNVPQCCSKVNCSNTLLIAVGVFMANYLDIAKHGHEHAHELVKLTQLP